MRFADTIRRHGLLLLILVIIIATYAMSLRYGFVSWDDEMLVVSNDLLRQPFLHIVVKAFTSYEPELYAPLTTLSYAIEYKLFGLQPFVFHADNLLLHLINVVLIYLIILRVTGKKLLSLLTVFLWGLHPLNTETVVWISARKDLLATVFALGSVLTYLRAREDHRYPWVSIVLFLCGLLAKVAIAPLPLVLFLYDWVHHRSIREILHRTAPFFAAAFVLVIVAVFGKDQNFGSLSIVETLLLSAHAIWFYLIKLLYPIPLLIAYPVELPIDWLEMRYLLSISVFIIALIALWVFRRYRFVLVGAAWYLLFLLPSFASFNRAGEISYASDHYSYLAIIAPLSLIAGLIDFVLTKKKIIGYIVISGLTVALVTLTFRQSMMWSSSERLYATASEQYPDTAFLHYNLGVGYAREKRWEEAETSLKTAHALKPSDANVLNNLGMAYRAMGKPIEAHAAFTNAVAADPLNPAPYNNRGSMFLDEGKIDEAIADLKRAVELNPDFSLAWRNLGAAYGKKGMYEEGLEAFERAKEL